ncbi:MAG: hypothetical protein DRO52_01450 [Candidatus Hecatellales archaeon]|nr:MAG: hypothetical protein DRO52_01450 [Candidatus Hecatellales archaeon]
MYGYAGRILRVDLTEGKTYTVSTTTYADRFLGGIGFADKIYWDEARPDMDPFDPESLLFFTVGPLTGTLVPGSARTIVAGKSPITYPRPAYTRSSFGGEWGPELKFAGYDCLVIKGKAEKPVYLWIQDDNVEIRDATRIWGADAYATQDLVKREVGDERAQVVAIGPAGEKLVRFACIIHRRARAAGQGGFGAVMGSKNLKAIAVRGTKGVAVADPEGVLALREYVTPRFVICCSSIEDSRRFHATRDHWNITKMANPWIPPFIKKYGLDSRGRVRNTGCFACPIGCHNYCEVPGFPGGEISCLQWWYANLITNRSPLPDEKAERATWEAKTLADQYGLNAYEFMQMIPLLRALHADGIIDDEKTGIPISKFPDREFMVTLLRKITYREGFGDILAEGTWRAAEKLGVLEEHFLKRDLGEFSGSYFVSGGAGGHGFSGHYDPRAFILDALLWAMYSRDPFDHAHEDTNLVFWSGLPFEEQKKIAKEIYGSENAIHPIGKPEYDEDKARAVIIIENRANVKDALTLCDWLYPMILDAVTGGVGDLTVESKFFTAVTGKEMTYEELLKIGERLWNLERAIMVTEGRTRKDDTLPDLYFMYPQKAPEIPSPPIDREKFEELKTHYYRLRGWDPSTGYPTEEKLKELGLEDVAAKLREMGKIG